ncbi:unnamed protein product [Trichobilharzia szidati]|nr:unnamed protein product [Trichobilharzia szidati]
MNPNCSKIKLDETCFPMPIKPNLKYDKCDIENQNYLTQTKIIHFFNTYKYFLHSYANHFMHKVNNDTFSLNTSNSNEICSLSKSSSSWDGQNTLNSGLSTISPFKPCLINAMKESQLGRHLSAFSPMNTYLRHPHLHQLRLSSRHPKLKSSNPTRVFPPSSSSPTYATLFYENYPKTKLDSTINPNLKLLPSTNNDKMLNETLSTSSAVSVNLPSSLKPSSSKLPASLSSSPSSLSSDSVNTSKNLTVQVLKRLAKLPNHLGPHICQLCYQYFENALKLANHRCPLILHTDYRCPECDKVFSCPANLASHRRWHKPKLNVISDHRGPTNHTACTTNHNYNNFTSEKYFDCNDKNVLTYSKYSGEKITSNNLPRSDMNSIPPLEDQQLMENKVDGQVCDQFRHYQINHCVTNSNFNRKLNFSVQTLLEDPFSCSDEYLIRSDLKVDSNEKAVCNESSISYQEQTSLKTSEKSCLAICTTANDCNIKSNAYLTADITQSTTCNVNYLPTEKQTSIKCNYCHSVLPSQSLFETHMLQHIFNNLKSVDLLSNSNSSG